MPPNVNDENAALFIEGRHVVVDMRAALEARDGLLGLRPSITPWRTVASEPGPERPVFLDSRQALREAFIIRLDGYPCGYPEGASSVEKYALVNRSIVQAFAHTAFPLGDGTRIATLRECVACMALRFCLDEDNRVSVLAEKASFSIGCHITKRQYSNITVHGWQHVDADLYARGLTSRMRK